jgi:Protein of unknown function (DUF2635)
MTKNKAALNFEGLLRLAAADGRKVRKTDGTPLHSDGEAVHVDEERSYWLRRLNDGDIIATEIENGETA